MKYAVLVVTLILILLGAYYSGYSIGKRDTKIEYVEKKVEVIRYVEKQKAQIYSTPVNSPDALIGLFNNGIL